MYYAARMQSAASCCACTMETEAETSCVTWGKRRVISRACVGEGVTWGCIGLKRDSKERNQMGAGRLKTKGKDWTNGGRGGAGTGEQSRAWKGWCWGGAGLKGRQVDCCTDVVAMNAGRAPEVQVSHASAACLTLAGTHNDFGSLLDAPCKLLSLGLHTFLQWKAIPTCGVSHQAVSRHPGFWTPVCLPC